MEEQNDKNIQEDLMKLVPHSYESTLSTCKTSYKELSTDILNAIHDILFFIPVNFINLTFIIDLCQESNDFLNAFKSNLNDWLKESKNPINLLINIYILEKYKFFKEGTFELILTKNDINELNNILQTNIVSTKMIIQTKREDDKAFDLELEEFIIQEQFITEIRQTINAYKNCNYSNINGDALISFQIVTSFTFSLFQCKMFLLNHFHTNDHRNLFYGIMMFLKENKEKKVFVLSLLLALGKVEFFLATFYNLFSEVYEDADIKEFLNLYMAMLYEKFYYPVKEGRSIYKSAAEYDPVFASHEAEQYFNLLNVDIVNEILKYSDPDVLRYNLKEELKQLIVYTNILPEVNIDLKPMIENNEFDKINEMDKVKFFEGFFYLVQYSVTHFLTYLEILHDCFKLNDEEQRLFCNLFIEKFNNMKTYKKVLWEKICTFNLINSTIRSEYNEVFK